MKEQKIREYILHYLVAVWGYLILPLLLSALNQLCDKSPDVRLFRLGNVLILVTFPVDQKYEILQGPHIPTPCRNFKYASYRWRLIGMILEHNHRSILGFYLETGQQRLCRLIEC